MVKNDRAQMEIGKVWTSICRKYNIAQCTSEAHMEWQNEAERAIQEVKKMVNLIMDRTGCPKDLWVMCSHYVVFLLNHLAQPNLDWRTPIEACYGYTPDISPLLLLHFSNEFIIWMQRFPFLIPKKNWGDLLELLRMWGMHWKIVFALWSRTNLRQLLPHQVSTPM